VVTFWNSLCGFLTTMISWKRGEEVIGWESWEAVGLARKCAVRT